MLSPDSSGLSRFSAAVGLLGLAGAAAGAGLAVVMLRIDRAIGATLPIPFGNAQVVLGSLVGAVVTVAVFTMWMRTVVVGTTAGQISPRVANSYLDDGFQRLVTGWMACGVAYLIVVALALPEDQVPAISVVLAILVALSGLVAVLVAMRHAVTSLSPPAVVRSLADQALARLERSGWPDDDPPEEVDDGAHRRGVEGEDIGWVHHVHHRAIADRLPPGGDVVLRVDVGDFVARGDVLATVGGALDEADADAIRQAIVLGATRDTRHDLGFAIQQLVDVAQHAVASATHDTSTGHEVLVHLRAVLDELIRRGTASGCLRADDRRLVVSAARRAPADHLMDVSDRLRDGISDDPLLARTVLGMFSGLRRTAEQVGDTRSEQVARDEHGRLSDALASEEDTR